MTDNYDPFSRVVVAVASKFPAAFVTIWIGNIIHFSLLMIIGNIVSGNPPDIEWDGIARFSLTSVIFLNLLFFSYSGAIVLWMIFFLGSFLLILFRPPKKIYRLIGFTLIAVITNTPLLFFPGIEWLFIYILLNIFVIAFMFLFSEFWFKKIYRRGQRKRAEAEAKASAQTKTAVETE